MIFSLPQVSPAIGVEQLPLLPKLGTATSAHLLAPCSPVAVAQYSIECPAATPSIEVPVPQKLAIAAVVSLAWPGAPHWTKSIMRFVLVSAFCGASVLGTYRATEPAASFRLPIPGAKMSVGVLGPAWAVWRVTRAPAAIGKSVFTIDTPVPDALVAIR